MSFSVVTWNFGSDEEFLAGLKSVHKEIPEGSDIAQERDRVAKLAFETFLNSHVDILCLQNVGSHLDAVKGFLGEDFEVKSDGSDTAIAYRFRFEHQSHSSQEIDGRRYTIVTLKDRLTETTFNVASAHFNFDIKDVTEIDSFSRQTSNALQAITASENPTIIGLYESTDTNSENNLRHLHNIDSTLRKSKFKPLKGVIKSRTHLSNSLYGI